MTAVLVDLVGDYSAWLLEEGVGERTILGPHCKVLGALVRQLRTRCAGVDLVGELTEADVAEAYAITYEIEPMISREHFELVGRFILWWVRRRR